MSKSLEIGYVSEVSGKRIRIKTYDKTNNQTYFINGETYQGCTVGSYIGILQNQYKIIARVEKEYLTDLYDNKNNTEQTEIFYSLDRFEREVEVTLLGYFMHESFELGIKNYPQIYNKVILLSKNEIISVLTGQFTKTQNVMYIGNTLTENIEYPIKWGDLFNTHIGIFGNTGSGKSHTLAKLYSTLFSIKDVQLQNVSKFIVIDFNGEYINEGILNDRKKVFDLSTRKFNRDTHSRLPITSDHFLNIEMLSVLFSATEQTQKPFLERVLNHYGESLISDDIALFKDHLKNGFINTYMGGYKRESKNLFSNIMEIIKGTIPYGYTFEEIEWHNKNQDFINPETGYAIGDELQVYLTKSNEFRDDLDYFDENIIDLNITDKLYIYCCLQLIYGLRFNYTQYDYISPLLNRIAVRSVDFNKIFKLGDENFYDDNFLYIISLKNCNQEMKKLIPLILVKQIYNLQKESVDTEILNTTHLIIDEAHNILSEKSNRESITWKDYRLETFEEIIKEGRKFGFYLTVSSQRPSDISPTIISQLHNYFLHRLVNDHDLKTIDNTISSLDTVSKETIPTLAPGQTVLTGTVFQIPQIIKVKLLATFMQPRSESANLENIWLE